MFEAKEKELYELMLPETRDRYTSETTNAAKSAFRDVYEKVGEFTLEIFEIKIKSLKTYEKELVKCNLN